MPGASPSLPQGIAPAEASGRDLTPTEAPAGMDKTLGHEAYPPQLPWTPYSTSTAAPAPGAGSITTALEALS